MKYVMISSRIVQLTYTRFNVSDNGGVANGGKRSRPPLISDRQAADEVSTTSSPPVTGGSGRVTATPEISSTCNGILPAESSFNAASYRPPING